MHCGHRHVVQTLLNVIAGDPVFVTMDELADFDSLSQAVRCKVVNRADREVLLLDVDGVFPEDGCGPIDDSALKLFCCVYAVSSVIVWNDTLSARLPSDVATVLLTEHLFVRGTV